MEEEHVMGPWARLNSSTKTVIIAATLALLVSGGGYLWTVIVDGRSDDIRQNEQIDTNADRISTIKQDDRVDDIVRELRNIKVILEQNGM